MPSAFIIYVFILNIFKFQELWLSHGQIQNCLPGSVTSDFTVISSKDDQGENNVNWGSEVWVPKKWPSQALGKISLLFYYHYAYYFHYSENLLCHHHNKQNGPNEKIIGGGGGTGGKWWPRINRGSRCRCIYTNYIEFFSVVINVFFT